MMLEKLREMAKKIVSEVDFQEIKDSPTIKYYTDWNCFEEYKIPPSPINDNVILPKNVISTIIKEPKTSLEMRLSKIYAIHFASLSNIKKIIIDRDGSYDITLLAKSEEKFFEASHTIIDVKPNINVRLNINEKTLGKSSFNGVMEIYLGANVKADIRISTMHKEDSPTFSYYLIQGAGGSEITLRLLTDGSKMHRMEVNLVLAEDQATSLSKIAVIGKGNRKTDLIFRGILKADRNVLNLISYGLAVDNSYVNIRAIGDITQESRNGIVNIETKTYHMSKNAKAIGVPILNIGTNRVIEARHAVSISNLNDSELFYLASRGLSRNEIIRLLETEIRNLILNDF